MNPSSPPINAPLFESAGPNSSVVSFKPTPWFVLDCGGQLRVIAFVTAPAVIRKILNHLDLKLTSPRAPPEPAEPNVH